MKACQVKRKLNKRYNTTPDTTNNEDNTTPESCTNKDNNTDTTTTLDIATQQQQQLATTKITNDEIKDALLYYDGFMAKAADSLGCTYALVASRVKRCPELKDIVDHSEEQRLDVAEQALLKAVKRGKHWAIQFYLKYKGSSRGYKENKDIKTPSMPMVFQYIVQQDKENNSIEVDEC